MALIKKGHGSATLKTVSGGTITVMSGGMSGMNAMNEITVKDEKGNTATVTIADVWRSNGVIHVIDSVLLPN